MNPTAAQQGRSAKVACPSARRQQRCPRGARGRCALAPPPGGKCRLRPCHGPADAATSWLLLEGGIQSCVFEHSAQASTNGPARPGRMRPTAHCGDRPLSARLVPHAPRSIKSRRVYRITVRVSSSRAPAPTRREGNPAVRMQRLQRALKAAHPSHIARPVLLRAVTSAAPARDHRGATPTPGQTS